MNLQSFLCHGYPGDPMWVKLNLSPSLTSLVSLSLVNVHLKDQDLHNLLLGCCSLEKLLLNSCEGLLNLEVSSLSLEFLETMSCTCKTFQVEAMNLRSFIRHGYPRDLLYVMAILEILRGSN
ncbi:LRR domain containing protein [Parasponia andersonii]|uniref:LRR domain containing protein n=1 Tax=Parasponia andersonii TaxID=3476 RepID=A0A2P5DFG5_PARAD|nr:LRR domain containing protein [Parasponia andersonii]